LERWEESKFVQIEIGLEVEGFGEVEFVVVIGEIWDIDVGEFERFGWLVAFF
jgi:hypothetical protein